MSDVCSVYIWWTLHFYNCLLIKYNIITVFLDEWNTADIGLLGLWLSEKMGSKSQGIEVWGEKQPAARAPCSMSWGAHGSNQQESICF